MMQAPHLTMTGFDQGEAHRKPPLPVPTPDGVRRLKAHEAQATLDAVRAHQRHVITTHQLGAALTASLNAQRREQAELARQRQQQKADAKVRSPAMSQA